MATASTKPATLDDFLKAEANAPEGMRLALIDGEIIEWGANLLTRKAIHGYILTKLSYHIVDWFDQSELVGIPATGEVRCRLQRKPETIVGIDVGLWLGPEHADPEIHHNYFDGPPALAVDIFSPVKAHEITDFRLRRFLNAGVQRVWQIDTVHRTLTICRLNRPSQTVGTSDQLPQDAALPELSFPIGSLFATMPIESKGLR